LSRFTTHGAIYPFRAADTGSWAWALAQPLVWEVRGLGGGFTITAPVGFVTDLGSIPPIGRIVVNPADAQLAKAFVLHDFILAEFGPACQPFAASQLYEALRALGAPRWKRKMIVAAVVAGTDD
jgi:hypothetical protein